MTIQESRVTLRSKLQSFQRAINLPLADFNANEKSDMSEILTTGIAEIIQLACDDGIISHNESYQLFKLVQRSALKPSFMDRVTKYTG